MKRTCRLGIWTAGTMVVLCFAGARCTGETKMNQAEGRTVRRARGGGRWFPAGGGELRSAVEGYIDKAEVPPVKGRIVSALAPHAGYVYSGKVAGFTFRAIRDNAGAGAAPETVVVLGLRHRGGLRGVALMDGDAIETPLGVTALDREAAALMARSSDRVFLDYQPHDGEHSAENEIPFVQVALPKAALVVGIIGDHENRTLDALHAALLDLAGTKRILVVASTDMLHDPDYDLVRKTDLATLKQVEGLDHQTIGREWSGRKQTFCGVCPVIAAMRFAEAQGCRRGLVLHYRNSGDDFPESRGQWVVGYGAVVFAAPETEQGGRGPQPKRAPAPVQVSGRK